MSVIGNIVEKLMCVTLTQSLMTRYVIILNSMAFLGLGFIEKEKRNAWVFHGTGWRKFAVITWTSVLGCGCNQVGI